MVSLRFFKTCGLIHSDLKPENIVFRLDSDDRVKVIDFGSATYVYEQCQDYVQTRPYRAPEIIFGCDYDFGVDMWSVGCILFELLTAKVLFSQKNLHQIIAQVVSLEISRRVCQLQAAPAPCTPARKSSRDSDELWSKTSSRLATKDRQSQSPAESEREFSGKTEVRKLHSKPGNAGKSLKSNDTAHNRNKKPARAARDRRVAEQVARELSATFEKFESGSRFKELVTKGSRA
ncbi:MAG: protein kinase [Planctomycetota bacterium]